MRQSIGHSGAALKIKAFDFSHTAIFVFQSEVQAESIVERADAHEFPFSYPISKSQVLLGEDPHTCRRAHPCQNGGCTQDEVLNVRQGVDLGSSGARGDVFIRDGDQGGKLFKVYEDMEEGKHWIDANMAELQKIQLDTDAVKAIIAATHAEVGKPFRA